ncbi:MAG TPA: hypothetical protein VFQ23_13825 [Anaerolineales bacterium]|nr:hypothetical protein [Anaerolineales bacterium]
MHRSQRFILVFLVAALVVFLGMLFWPFVLNNILQPTALTLWLLLRILVLSIHQQYFWYTVILVAAVVLVRLLRETQPERPPQASFETNTALSIISDWRDLLLYNGQEALEDKTLKRQLANLLTSLYALKQGASNDFRLYDDLQRGTIPLPENIHTFLFAPEPASGGPLQKFFQSIQKAPRRWIRQWTGQAKAEHHKMIDDVLNFIETSLEINSDDKKPSQNKH